MEIRSKPPGGSKPMVPFGVVSEPPFLVYFSGWLGMFTGGTVWLLTHGQLSYAKLELLQGFAPDLWHGFPRF